MDFLDFGGIGDWIMEGVANVGEFVGDISNSIFGDTPQDLNATPAVTIPESTDTLAPPPGIVQDASASADPLTIVKTEFDKGPDSFKKWASTLSNEEKSIFGTALKEGAKAALTKSAMDNQSEEKRGIEERARQDKIRRGQVSAVPQSAFTPRPLPGGLIASAKGA